MGDPLLASFARSGSLQRSNLTVVHREGLPLLQRLLLDALLVAAHSRRNRTKMGIYKAAAEIRAMPLPER